jgi:hypothetical protein
MEGQCYTPVNSTTYQVKKGRGDTKSLCAEIRGASNSTRPHLRSIVHPMCRRRPESEPHNDSHIMGCSTPSPRSPVSRSGDVSEAMQPSSVAASSGQFILRGMRPGCIDDERLCLSRVSWSCYLEGDQKSRSEGTSNPGDGPLDR